MKHSEYMHWAKMHRPAKWNLATSGLTPASIGDFQLSLSDIEVSGTSGYGYEPLLAELSKKSGAPADCIVTAAGTSMANHLAMAAILEPGDEVLIEQPTYEPLLAVANYLRASVKRFSRKFEKGFQIDPDELRRLCSPATRLIVITNLHNPSGVLLSDRILAEIGRIAEQYGSLVLVDEVYRETIMPPKPSAFFLGPQFVTTCSLTKAYGLSGLRCGWILASPELSRKMWRLNDLFGATGPHPAERLSVVALQQLDSLTKRAQSLLAINRRSLFDFLDQHQEKLEVLKPEFGTIAFPRLKNCESADAFCDALEMDEVTVVPGRCFEMPAHFRIGIGEATNVLEEGLRRMNAALLKID
jgi:aspartate/methionine/tyrosine aminotransferase